MLLHGDKTVPTVIVYGEGYTPKPTATPRPTATPKPTNTPRPTATPTPSPTPGAEEKVAVVVSSVEEALSGDIVALNVFTNLTSDSISVDDDDPEINLNNYLDGSGLSFQWQRSLNGTTWTDTTLDGADTETLLFTASGDNCRYSYRCRVTSQSGETVTSDGEKVGLLLRVTVMASNPNPQTGESVTLTASAADAVRYTWQSSVDGGATWTALTTGANTYSLVAGEESCAPAYRCLAEDSLGNSGVSDPFWLNLDRPQLAAPVLTINADTTTPRLNDASLLYYFTEVERAEGYILRISESSDMSGYLEYDSRDHSIYDMVDGILMYPRHVDGPRGSVSFLKQDTTYYVTIEAVAEGYRSGVSGICEAHTYGGQNAALPAPDTARLVIENNKPLVYYGFSSVPSDVAGVLIYRNYRGEEEEAPWFQKRVSVTDSAFGCFHDLQTLDKDHEAADLCWYILAAYDASGRISTARTYVTPETLQVQISGPTSILRHGETIRLTASAPDARTYEWQRKKQTDTYWNSVAGHTCLDEDDYDAKLSYTGADSATLTFTATQYSQEYIYRCVVRDSQGFEGASAAWKAAGYKVSWKGAGVTLRAANTSNNIVSLSWSSDAAAPAYEVYEVTDSGSTTLLKTVTGTSCTLADVTPGQHTYRVRGCETGATGYARVSSNDTSLTVYYVNLVDHYETTVGLTITWPAVVRPEGTRVNWTSSNPSVAAVTKNGGATATIVSKSPGRTTITATVGTVSKNAELVITGGKYRALSVYQYSYPAVTYGKSYRFQNDGLAFAEGLRTARFADGSGYDRVHTLKDGTKASIRSAIASAASGATEDDVFLLFWSGHGWTKTSGSLAGALALANGENITGSELASWLGAIPGKKIFITESCGSGALIGRGEEEMDPKAFNESLIDAFRQYDAMHPQKTDIIEPDSEFAISEDGEEIALPESRNGELAKSGFYVITAAGTGESGYGIEMLINDNSNAKNWLGYYLLQGMGLRQYSTGVTQLSSMPADTNWNGDVSFQEAYNYTQKMIAPMTFSGGEKQHVKMYMSGSDLTLYSR